MELRRLIISIVSRLDRKGFREANAEIAALKRNAAGASEAVDEVGRSQQRASGRAREHAAATKEVGTQQAKTNVQLRDASGKFSGAGESASRSAGGFKSLSGGMQKAASVAKFAAIAAVGAAAAFAAIAIPVLKTGMEMEVLRSRLDNLLGGAEAGAKAFGFIQSFAAKTPFQLQQVTQAFIKLQTAGVDPTEQRLTALGDLASSFGGDLESITDAITAAARGELDPLEKFGLSAKTSGDKIIVSFKGQKIAIDKTTESITDALVKFGQYPGIAGAMEAQSRTLAGQLSNAQDALGQFLNTAAQAGPLERTGEILGELREKFMNPKNAELLGRALDVVFKIIRDALKGVDPGTVTDGFKLLLNVLELLARALQPFIWLWKQTIQILSAAEEATSKVLDVLDSMKNALLITTPLEEGIRGVGEAFGFMNSEAEGTGKMLDALKAKATETLSVLKAALSGAITKSMTDEELQAAIDDKGTSDIGRKKALEEQASRKKKKLEEAAKARQKAEQRFDVTAPLDKAATEVGEKAAQTEFHRLVKTGMPEDAAKKQASVVGVAAEEKERKRLGDGGKIAGKGKTKDDPYDFVPKARAAAKSQAAKFAEEEFERLVAMGVDSSDLDAQGNHRQSDAARMTIEAARAKEEELTQAFIKAGKIFEVDTNNILTMLGLNKPGTVLEGRPPPSTLIIAPVVNVTMIGEFIQQIASVAGADALSEITGQAGEAAAAAGFEKFMGIVKKVVQDVLYTEVEELVEADGDGEFT
jgi:hypothetical protein